MSVHLIQISDGKKMMLPVASREEYLALRDSEQNRNADKKHMVQMNYSCLPNEDGTLRGSTRMSTTVGMDIDKAPLPNPSIVFTHPSGSPGIGESNLEGEEMDSQEDWFEDVKQKILSKKDELGLLMLERSASKGFHIVFRRREELSQEDNLRWASGILGVEYDKGAKDITRVFYTPPSEKLLYLDDALFEQEEALTPFPLPEGRGVNTPKEDVPATSEVSTPSHLVEDHSTPLPSSLAAFDLCAKYAGLDPEKMDIWGEHNWHTNLMAVLSVGLPKLMSKEQLLAVVREKLPNYSQTDDCPTLIDYFYEKYTADKGFMSTTLREINAEAQRQAASPLTQGEGSEEDDKALAELSQDWTPPQVPNKIPRLMNLLTNNYDPRFREMLLLSALPVLSAHASHYRATYINGRVTGPQQYVAIIGASGKGKGNCTELYKEMILNTLEEHDNQEWEKVRLNSEERDKKANAKERPAKYHPQILLFEGTSKSSILELQTNAGKNSMLLGQFSEVDGLSAATRSAFSDISVLLRKGWDMDMHRQYYMSDSTCNTCCQMNISLLLEGTVRAMLERMFSDSNCEGGFMQRCIPVLVPKAKRTFRPPQQNFLTDDEKAERDALLIELYQKNLSLGDDICLLDTPLTNRAIGQWYDELEERYNDGLLTDAEADLSHRCGEFMIRAAIPLIALYGKETKEIVDFARWVGEMAHYTMCHIFGHRVQMDIIASNKLLENRVDGRKTAEPLLNKMPEIFTTKQLQAQREKDGQSTDVRMLLSRYCKNGKLERIGRGVYRKGKTERNCNIVTVTKIGDPTKEDSE